MRTRTLLAVVGLGTAALLAGTAPTASAAPGDTTTTFALAGSTLSVSVESTATLSDGTSGATSVSGSLGNVTVTDARGGTTPWSAKAASTTFTNGGTGAGLTESTAVTYNSGTVTTTGISVIGPKGAVALNATAAEVVAPDSVVGNNTAQWNPTLTVTLPSSSLVGSYTGTITTSVS